MVFRGLVRTIRLRRHDEICLPFQSRSSAGARSVPAGGAMVKIKGRTRASRTGARTVVGEFDLPSGVRKAVSPLRPATALQNAAALNIILRISARFWTAVAGVFGRHRFRDLPSQPRAIDSRDEPRRLTPLGWLFLPPILIDQWFIHRTHLKR